MSLHSAAPEVTLDIEKVCLVTNDRNLSVKARARDLRDSLRAHEL
jgi:hypothetical protein